jgi:predicted RecB family nuclease
MQASGPCQWHYEIFDTKLSRQPKASHVLQLSVYAELLDAMLTRHQVTACRAHDGGRRAERDPPGSEQLHIVLADMSIASFSRCEYRDFARAAMERLEYFAQSQLPRFVSPAPLQERLHSDRVASTGAGENAQLCPEGADLSHPSEVAARLARTLSEPATPRAEPKAWPFLFIYLFIY